MKIAMRTETGGHWYMQCHSVIIKRAIIMSTCHCVYRYYSFSFNWQHFIRCLFNEFVVYYWRWLGSRVVSKHAGLRRKRARVQIAAATLSSNSLRQSVHTCRASVHQAAKLAAALLRVAGVTTGLAESNGSLPPCLWLTSPAGWLPRTGISSATLPSVIEYGLHFCILFILEKEASNHRSLVCCMRLIEQTFP